MRIQLTRTVASDDSFDFLDEWRWICSQFTLDKSLIPSPFWTIVQKILSWIEEMAQRMNVSILIADVIERHSLKIMTKEQR